MRAQKRNLLEWSEESGARLAERRAEMDITQDALAQLAGLDGPSWISKIERGQRPKLATFKRLCAGLRLREEWVLTGEDGKELPMEAPHIATDDAIAPPGTVMLRVVGDVAARRPWDYNPDSRMGEEVPIPSAYWAEGCQGARARGDSMVEEGILDGDLLVFRAAEDGGYRQGQVVIATVDGGMVVKVYGGQRHGEITLRSANPSVPDIRGPVGRIEIRAVVTHVIRNYPNGRDKGGLR